MNENSSNTPFDDAYRTLSVKGKRLMIPLINYMFKQHYPMDTLIELKPNVVYKSDSKKLITDSEFVVGEKEVYNLFIIEEQTEAKTDMPFRLYDYMLAHASRNLHDTYDTGRIIIPTVGVLNLRGDNKDVKTMKLVHTNGEIDVTMKSISMKNIQDLDYLAKHDLYCLMPYYGFIIEDKLRNSETKDAEKLYRQELNKYYDILEQAVAKGKIDEKERFLLHDLRNKVINAMRFEKDGLDVKELEKMGGQVLDLPYYDGLVKAEEQANQKTFFNIMTMCLKKQKNKEDGVNDGIQMCKDILPDWDNNKIQSELTAIHKELKLDLNINDIFLNFDVIGKINNKDFKKAYTLYCKNETVNEEEKPLEFMKKVVKVFGTNGDIINKAIEVIVSIEGEEDNPRFKVKLLNDTQKTIEYKKAFEAMQGEKRENVK